MPRCLRCPWNAESTDQFCALCGIQLATCEIENSVLQGLLFYQDYPGSDGHSFEIKNRGNVSTTIEFSLPPSFILETEELSASSGSLIIEANNKITVKIISKVFNFSSRDYFLIKSAVIKNGFLSIPLLVSEKPTFRLQYGNANLMTNHKESELFPLSSGECRWSLQLIPIRGSALVRRVTILSEITGLKITDLADGRLLHSHEREKLELIWDHPGESPVIAQIQIESDGIPNQSAKIRLHPKAAVSLRNKVTLSFGELLVIGARPQRVFIEFWNDGFKSVKVLNIKSNTAGCELTSAKVLASTEEKNKSEGREYLCRGATLPPPAQLPIGGYGGIGVTEGDWLSGIFITISSKALQSLNDDILRLDFRVNLAIIESDQKEIYHEESIFIDIPAKKIRIIDPHQGHLCIDYGTVHSCAYISANQYEQMIYLDNDGGFEFKSAYLVEDWGRNEFKYGERIWRSIPEEFSRIDFASKLRLGTNRKRYLKDRQNVLRGVSGSQAASYLLSEIIERVKERTGYEFKSIKLSQPAAFDQLSTEDLRLSVQMLGFDPQFIETPCSEPEAYLYHLSSDDQFRKLFDIKIAESDGINSFVGIIFDIGGGTTDVTIFEYRHNAEQKRNMIEIISSHGYRWLGGEMLTHQIAAFLYKSIKNSSEFDFPEIKEGEFFEIEHINSSNVAMSQNFSTLRTLAETIKCSDDLIEKKTWSESISLFDNKGHRSNVEIKIESGDSKSGLTGLMWRIIGQSIDDTIERMSRMRRYRILSASIPQVMVIAGNGGRLWCLNDIIRHKLKEAGASESEIFFDSANTKTGVVHGLSSWGQIGFLPINARQCASHWWYIRIGPVYHLAKPAGARFGKKPQEHTISISEQSIYLQGTSISLAQGPGPEEKITSDSYLRLKISHSVTAHDLHGQYVDVVLEFDEQGDPGLWMRLAAPDQDQPWVWHKAKPNGSL
ncbi:hypothetical protein KJ940_08175 [Myxococcota bacterium]|nr:hypothetical protein [Myxococcota bacterium]